MFLYLVKVVGVGLHENMPSLQTVPVVLRLLMTLQLMFCMSSNGFKTA